MPLQPPPAYHLINLAARLEAVLQQLVPCALLADIGTDHGLLPVAAVLRGLAARAVAVDVNAAPLLGAGANIAHAGVADRVATVHGDGLLPLASQGVDAVVMAGMSGRLMVRLCEAAPHILASVQQLVLQPNQDIPNVRSWAQRSGWHLRDECMLEARSRFFTVCAFAKGQGKDPAYAVPGWTAAMLTVVGPRLVLRKDAVAARWCEAQRVRLQKLVCRGVRTLEPELLSWQTACELLR